MALSLFQWVCLMGMAVTAVFFAAEVRRWRAIGSVIGPRQRLLRTCLIVVMELLFAMILVGPWVTLRRDPLTELIYWTVCVVVALVVVVAALLDLREVLHGYASMHRRIRGDWREKERREP